MKKLFLALLIVSSLAIFATAFIKKNIPVIKGQKGFAVIELFTSEGCSSCPSADEALGEIQNEYKNKNVLVLGFHVDYWDHLGWKDAFSSPEFTERQKYYSSIFNLSSIYTPQAVINGQYEFVGSDKNKIVDLVEEQLKSRPSKIINLLASESIKGDVDVKFSVNERASSKDQLILLLIERAAVTNVKRGENNGRTLYHINIVRKISSRQVSAGEQIESFNLPSDLSKGNAFIASFLQNKKTGAISGLDSVEIK
ncbi:MAG: DUF1223 domain-containing protein [Bacteroidetes bacterium]|nr:DUF1223 domain-containing protein [Bacteroidota bacterium]MBS1930161.1 DUF1223 domain-containing protein [Bacteroidota bacterium]